MSANLKIVLAILIIIAIFIIIKNIKNKKLQLSFSIFSIITGFLMIIALAVPSLLDNISSFFGFELTSNMLFLVAIFVIFYLIFRLMIIASSEYRTNVKLTQELSILKKKVEQLDEKLDKQKHMKE